MSKGCLAPSGAYGGDEPLPPVAANLYTALSDGGFGLLGGRCTRCGRHHFPFAERSPCCREECDCVVIGRSGRIYSHTMIHTKAPFQFPEPYAVGYVDLDDSGLRVFALFHPRSHGSLANGLRVGLKVIPLGVDNMGRACLRPVFAPIATMTGEPA